MTPEFAAWAVQDNIIKDLLSKDEKMCKENKYKNFNYNSLTQPHKELIKQITNRLGELLRLWNEKKFTDDIQNMLFGC